MLIPIRILKTDPNLGPVQKNMTVSPKEKLVLSHNFFHTASHPHHI